MLQSDGLERAKRTHWDFMWKLKIMIDGDVVNHQYNIYIYQQCILINLYIFSLINSSIYIHMGTILMGINIYII